METLRYAVRLLCSLDWSLGRRRRAVVGLFGVVVTVAGFAVYGSRPVTAESGASSASGVGMLVERAQRMHALLAETELVYERDVAPLERALIGYKPDDVTLVRRISASLVREARRTGLEPRLLLAVLLVENPWLDPAARSSVGAQGLMQVMPMHRGKWKPCPPSLDDIEANICHGAHIFASYLSTEKGNVDRALLRYNGCVRGTNTPDCHQYPTHVYARAGRASLLAWRNLTSGTMAASR